MALTVEGNFALKDMIIRSDFRLVDSEVRAGDVVSRQRVSSLLQRQLGAAEAQQKLIREQLPPLVLPPDGGLPPGVPGGPAAPAPAPGAGGLGSGSVVGKQIYTVRGDSTTATVFRGPNLISDGFLVRVSGALTHASPILSTDEGITFLVSDSDVQSSIGRLGGDRDLINMGAGLPVVGDHGIGLIQVATGVGHVSQSTFDVQFHHSVRAGQRLCVEQDVAVGLHFYAVFEVAQFSGVAESTEYVRERIVESLRSDPSPAAFTPVMMRSDLLGNKIAYSLGQFDGLFFAGFRPVGTVTSEGVSLL